jgi:trans-aconitate methyltransferase
VNDEADRSGSIVHTPVRRAEGVRVADVGCGTGHSTNLLARAYPRSSFVGYDIAPDAVGRARAEADAYGLGNATFEVLDVARLPAQPAVDAVFAFDGIRDQVDPAGVLARIFDTLPPGGMFVMVDIKATATWRTTSTTRSPRCCTPSARCTA